MSDVYCSKVFWVVHVNSRQYVTWKGTRQEAVDYIGANPWLVVVEEGSEEHLRDIKNGIPEIE